MTSARRRAGAGRRPVRAAAFAAGPALAAGLALTACASPDAGAPAPASAPAPPPVLVEALAECTAATGYDPEAPDTAALDPTALGPGELEWRDCAYAAAMRIVAPRLAQPASLDAVIAADRQLTAAIAAGQATRAEREAVVADRMASLSRTEAAIRAAGAGEAGPAEALRPDPMEQRLRRELDVLNRLIR